MRTIGIEHLDMGELGVQEVDVAPGVGQDLEDHAEEHLLVVLAAAAPDFLEQQAGHEEISEGVGNRGLDR